MIKAAWQNSSAEGEEEKQVVPDGTVMRVPLMSLGTISIDGAGLYDEHSGKRVHDMSDAELAEYSLRQSNIVRDANLTAQRQQAHEQRCASLQEAWRQIPNGAPAKSVQSTPPQSLADARALREAAYRAYCERLSNAWRQP